MNHWYQPTMWIKAGAILLALLSNHVAALPDDNEQPINIQSDRASQKTLENGETTEYFGNVQMIQGSLKINGEHITIHSKNREVTSIIARGTPATFEQQSDSESPPVEAQAETLDYQLQDETVILLVDACIKKDGSTVTGKRIEYNIAAEKIKASGGGTDSSRVNMILLPDGKADTSCNKTTNIAE